MEEIRSEPSQQKQYCTVSNEASKVENDHSCSTVQIRQVDYCTVMNVPYILDLLYARRPMNSSHPKPST